MIELEKAARMVVGAWLDPHGMPELCKAMDALRRALEQPAQQEPVAWRYKKEGGGWFVSDNDPQYVEQWNDIEEIQPLYTRPQAREPLTDEEICRIGAQVHGFLLCNEGQWGIEMARAIEAAHGIGEKK